MAVCGHVGGVLLLPQQRILNTKKSGRIVRRVGYFVADGFHGWPTKPRHVGLAVSGVDICGWRRSTGGVVIPPPRPPPPVALISKGLTGVDLRCRGDCTNTGRCRHFCFVFLTWRHCFCSSGALFYVNCLFCRLDLARERFSIVLDFSVRRQ